MNLIIPVICILLIPSMIILLFYKYAEESMWCVPIISLIFAEGMFTYDIISFAGDYSIDERIILYFYTDRCQNLYLFYVPTVLASIIFTIIFYSIIFFNKHKEGKCNSKIIK